MFALMNSDFTFSGQTNDGTSPVKWNDMTLPPLRSMTKTERVANFVYDFVQAGSTPDYNTAGGTTYVVNKTKKEVTEVVAYTPWDAVKLADHKKKKQEQIDTDAEKASAKYALPSTYIMEEYRQAEADAATFLLDTTKPCPLSVSCWAQSNVAMTNIEAANYIITQATMFRGLLSQIRSIRLLGKAAVANADDGVAVDAAYAAVTTSIAALP